MNFEEMNRIFSIERVDEKGVSKSLKVFRPDGSSVCVDEYALAAKNELEAAGFRVEYIDGVMIVDMADHGKVLFDAAQTASLSTAAETLREEAQRLRLEWDMKKAARIMLDLAKEFHEDKPDGKMKVAIVGGTPSSPSIKQILTEAHGVSIDKLVAAEWHRNPEDPSIQQQRDDWHQQKLRKGPGHNKYSRKGKKK